MNDFVVHYSGACFERGGSPEQAEKKVHDKGVSLGEVLVIEATPLRPAEKEYPEENYVVSFEGEITVEAETKEQAENQSYGRLAHLGQIRVVAFKKEKQ